MGLADSHRVPATESSHWQRYSVFSLKVLRIATSLRIPCVLENPSRLLLLKVPGILKLERTLFCTRHKFDVCGFSTHWKKETELLCFDCSCFALDERRCHGRGCCSFSDRPHLTLQGSSPEGKNWTAIASAYPKRLARMTAAMIATAAVDRATSAPDLLCR